MTTVVGVDLSLTATGLCTIEHDGAVTYWVAQVKSSGKQGASLEQRRHRLGTLTHEINKWVDNARPELVCVEGPSFNSLGGQSHERAGLWWLVTYTLGQRYPVVEIPPKSRALYAAGKGNASKDEVLTAVVRRYAEAEVDNNNEADALILAAMGMRHVGTPIDSVPDANRAAMEKVRWDG